MVYGSQRRCQCTVEEGLVTNFHIDIENRGSQVLQVDTIASIAVTVYRERDVRFSATTRTASIAQTYRE